MVVAGDYNILIDVVVVSDYKYYVLDVVVVGAPGCFDPLPHQSLQGGLH